MAGATMTSRQRLLAAVRHEEPDRVPICPRIQWAWLDPDGRHRLAETWRPILDPMECLSPPTPNYLRTQPEQYDLPEVSVEQTWHEEPPCRIVERTFRTPAGNLTDRTRVPPAGREFGMAPNPVKMEYLVKSAEDLPALCYVLPAIRTNYDHAVQRRRELGEDGIVMINVMSELCHQAGEARDMADLMVDYYIDRPLFDALLGLFQQRTMAEAKAALEAGVEWLFLNSYYNSLSVGWSPAIFTEVFVPHITAVVELAHRYGAHVDYYDDGHLSQSMELIAGCGIDVLETCTPPPMCDFDLATAKRTVGKRVTLKGHIDLLYVVQRGTPERVERAVAEAMEIAKPGGGFIVGSSDCFREGTPPENIHAYFEACLKYGRHD